MRLTLLQTFISEQKEHLKTLKENLKLTEDKVSECKKNIENLQVQRGKLEKSLIADIELLLEKYSIQREAYHGRDFNGVCCQRQVGNTPNLFNELRALIRTKKDDRCEDRLINKKVEKMELISGLLDAAFAHLNISYPNGKEKVKPNKASCVLLAHWKKVGLIVILKAHVMEKHVCPSNNKWGIGDKEESFIEQGHQVGIKDNQRYAGLTTFEKKTASTLKTRAAASHPLVVTCKNTVMEFSKRKKMLMERVSKKLRRSM